MAYPPRRIVEVARALGPNGLVRSICEASFDGSLDERMRCHPAHNVCVVPCEADADSPPAWRCDDRMVTLDASDGVAICVNPTCGD